MLNYISLAPNIYLILLVSSGSDRLSLANGIDATNNELNIRRVLHYTIPYTGTIFVGVFSVAQLVEVTESAVPGGVIEVVNSNPARVKNILAFTGIAELLYFSISIFILNVYQFLIRCS